MGLEGNLKFIVYQLLNKGSLKNQCNIGDGNCRDKLRSGKRRVSPINIQLLLRINPAVLILLTKNCYEKKSFFVQELQLG